jgi:hypothetical protein
MIQDTMIMIKKNLSMNEIEFVLTILKRDGFVITENNQLDIDYYVDYILEKELKDPVINYINLKITTKLTVDTEQKNVVRLIMDYHPSGATVNLSRSDFNKDYKSLIREFKLEQILC